MAENEEGGPVYSPPSSQVDLAARQSGASQAGPDNARSFVVDGNDLSGYYGVSPEYMNYSDPTMKPMRAEEGPEAVVEAVAYGDLVEEEEPEEAEESGEPDDSDDDKKSDSSATLAL